MGKVFTGNCGRNWSLTIRTIGIRRRRILSWRMRRTNSSGVDIQTDHLILARQPGLIKIHKEDKTCRVVDFAVPVGHRVKVKESEKKNNYLDLAREMKRMWNIKVSIIPIVNDALGTVTKGLVHRLKDVDIAGRVETVQTTALMWSARIPRRVLKTWRDYLCLKLQWKTIS